MNSGTSDVSSDACWKSWRADIPVSGGIWVGLAVSGMALLSVSRVTGMGLNASVVSSASGCVVLVGTSVICVQLSDPGFGSSDSCSGIVSVSELGSDFGSVCSVLGWNGCAVGSSGQ